MNEDEKTQFRMVIRDASLGYAIKYVDAVNGRIKPPTVSDIVNVAKVFSIYIEHGKGGTHDA